MVEGGQLLREGDSNSLGDGMAVVGTHSLQMEKTVARVQVGTGLEDRSALVGGCEWTILACGSGLSLLEGVGWM